MVVHWWREGKSLQALRVTAEAQPGEGSPPSLAKESKRLESNLSRDLIAGRLASDQPRSLHEVERLEKKSHWRKSLLINGIGAIATCIVLFVFIATKFVHGAWIVVVLIPLLVLMFLRSRETTVNRRPGTVAADSSRGDRANFGHSSWRDCCVGVREIDRAASCDSGLR